MPNWDGIEDATVKPPRVWYVLEAFLCIDLTLDLPRNLVLSPLPYEKALASQGDGKLEASSTSGLLGTE
jgi:hypothetical protein